MRALDISINRQRSCALIDQSIVSGANFASMLLAGRFMSANAFGHFILAYAVCLIYANSHRALVTQPLNVLGATEDPTRLSRRLSALLLLHLAFLPLGAVAIFATGLGFFSDPGLWLAAFAYIGTFSVQELFRRWCYTRGDAESALKNDAISYLGQVFGFMLLGMQGRLGAASAFAVMAFSSLFAVSVSMPEVRLRWVRRPDFLAVLRQHWRFGGWLFATVIATWVASQLYPFLLADLGVETVAAFAACRNLLNGVGILVQTTNNYLPSRLRLALAEHGDAALHAMSRKALITVGGLAAAYCLTMALWAEPALALVYGERYRGAAPLLQILALGTFCTGIGAVLGAMALVASDTRSSFVANVCAAAVTFTVGIAAIARWGVTGAAWAASLSLFVAVAVQGWFIARSVGATRSGGAGSAQKDADPSV